jgi:ribosomal protein S25
MVIDTSVLMALATPVQQKIFSEVVRSRLVRFGDLVKRVGVDRAQAKEALQALKDASLIKEKESDVEDFSTYYVTAAGLEVERKVGS